MKKRSIRYRQCSRSAEKSESGHSGRGGWSLSPALAGQGQGHPEGGGKGRCQGPPDGSTQLQVQQRLHRSHAPVCSGQKAGDDGPLRHPGEIQSGRRGAARGVSSGRQGCKQR